MCWLTHVVSSPDFLFSLSSLSDREETSFLIRDNLLKYAFHILNIVFVV